MPDIGVEYDAAKSKRVFLREMALVFISVEGFALMVQKSEKNSKHSGSTTANTVSHGRIVMQK
jgi:hypothetical protein